MVCPQFRPLVGGYERAAERLAIGLAARGHAVDVLTDLRGNDWPTEEHADGIRIIRVDSIAKPGLHTLSSTAAFSRHLLCRGGSYDVVHIHQYGWLAAASIALALVRRTPSVLKLTNTEEDGIDATLPRGVAGNLARALHRRVSACVTTSERARIEAIRFGIGPTRIHRIPNPVDTARFVPASETLRLATRRTLGIGNGFLAISVSRLSTEKNHAMLIDAWGRLCVDHPRAELAILGSGPLADEVRSWVQRSPAHDRIRLVGSVVDPTPWYHAADAFLLPSHREGLSNSLMEAMSSGLPAICTRISGTEDIFAEAEIGLMVEAGDVDAFARAVDEAARNPEQRARWGTAARSYAERHYAIDRVVDATLAMYARLLATRMSTRPV
jgi:glycosyltransferase involved in cell wall biosynthesis